MLLWTTTRLVRRMGFCLFALFVTLACDPDGEEVLDSDLSTSRALQEIERDIEAGKYGETHSLLVLRGDQLLLEEYFDDYESNDLHYQYSVTKSIASLLIGIAIDQGLISSVDKPLLSFFPSYTVNKNLDAQKQDITLEDVLTMRAGFTWDEWSFPYTDPRNDANELIRSPDMIQHMLDLPMAHAPGDQFTYNSGCSMLLAAIIDQAAGMSAENFAAQHLFAPLEISYWNWDRGQRDFVNTGWGLHLRPLDMLKIGALVRNRGRVGETDVVSEEWIEHSTKDYGRDYGYQWWLSNGDLDYSARGWGGQFIFIVPKLDLIMVTTAGNFSGAFSGAPAGIQILEEIKKVLI